MKRKIWTFGAICALLISGCGKGSTVIQTSGNGMPKAADQFPAVNPMDMMAEDEQLITVTSREIVKTVPDMAEIIYAVTTQNRDASACQTENSEKVNQLVQVLKELGVEESSIQTSGYDMSPRYDWERNGEISGYETTTRVTVSNVKLDQTGTILSKSVEAGVNQVESVSFLSSNYDESYHQALKQAVTQAQEKAQALADASGCTLGRPVHITEFGSDQSARYVNTMRSAKMEAADMAAGMTVMPGEIEVEASISVDFAIQ